MGAARCRDAGLLDLMMEIFKHTAHRPWPLPGGPWIMKQEWHDLLFAHWAVPAKILRQLIPPTLEIDTFGGHLETIFEESNAPTGEDDFPERFVAIFQVAVPGEGHENI